MASLRAIARFATAADALAAATEIIDVPDDPAAHHRRRRRVRIVLPGDDGYDDGTAVPPDGSVDWATVADLGHDRLPARRSAA